MSQGRKPPPPTHVQRAIREGAKLVGVNRPVSTPVGGRMVTASDTAIPVEVEEPERTAPHDMSQFERIEWRQRQSTSDIEELGHAIGMVIGEQRAQRADLVEMKTGIKSLVELHQKADAREERRDERAAQREALVLQLEAKQIDGNRSSREKIVLSLIGVLLAVATAFTTYLMTRKSADVDAHHQVSPSPGGAAAHE